MVGRVRRARLASTKPTPVLRRVIIVTGILTHQREALYLLRVSVMPGTRKRAGFVRHVRLASIKSGLDQKHVPIVVPIQIHRKEALLRQNVLVMWATRVPTAAHVMLARRESTRQLRVAVPVLTVQEIQIRQQQVKNPRTVLATRDIQVQMVGRVRRVRRASTKLTLVLRRVLIVMGMLTH